MRRLRIALVPVLLALSCTEPQPAVPPGSTPDGIAGAGGGGAGGTPAECGQKLEIGQDACLDFGMVFLGQEKTLSVAVRNPGPLPLDVCTRLPDEAFTVEPERFHLDPGAEATLEVRFLGPRRGPHAGNLELGSCGGCPAPLAGLCLLGHDGVQEWTLEPSPVGFGEQEAGTTVCRDVAIHNTGDVPIYPRDIHLDDGLKRVPGTFELKLGGILNMEIPPGGQATFQLCFTPAQPGAEYSGNIVLYTDNQVQKLAVSGRSPMPCFGVEPPALDLGVTIPGFPVAGRITLRDLCGNGGSVEGVTWTDHSLELGHLALPVSLGEEGFPVDVTFDGTVDRLQDTVAIAVGDPRGKIHDLAVPVTARVLRGEPCILEVPADVRLSVPPGGVGEQEVMLHNRSKNACWVWGFELAGDGDPGFSLYGAPDAPLAIAGVHDLKLRVQYRRARSSVPAFTELLFRRMVAPGEDPLARVPVVSYVP